MEHNPSERSPRQTFGEAIYLLCLGGELHCLLLFAILVCKPIPRDGLWMQARSLRSYREGGGARILLGREECVLGWGLHKSSHKGQVSWLLRLNGRPLGATKVRQSSRLHLRWFESTGNVTSTSRATDKVNTDTAAAAQNARVFVRRPFRWTRIVKMLSVREASLWSSYAWPPVWL